MEFIENTTLPDVVTLDIEMPVMNGLETLKKIVEFNKNNPDKPDIGVVMVSSLSKDGAEITLKCLQEGAFDFVYKPDYDDEAENLASLKSQLFSKIETFYYRKDRLVQIEKQHAEIKKVIIDKKVGKPRIIRESKIKVSAIDAILIASSTGGPKILSQLLPQLTQKTDLPILLVQHMPPIYTLSLAENLNRRCEDYSVVEAEDGKVVSSKTVYIAPGGKHLTIKRAVNGSVLTEINNAPPENNCKPSADVLFRSAGRVYDGRCLVIVLTGMGDDGTRGVRTLKRKGIPVIVQDKKTSTVWGMPGSVAEAGLADHVLPIDRIKR